MKKVCEVLAETILTVISVPLFAILCAVYLLYLPFDIIRYRKMPYYRNFKVKYSFLITTKSEVKIYNRIVSENLPVEFVRYGDIEYFVKDEEFFCVVGNLSALKRRESGTSSVTRSAKFR